MVIGFVFIHRFSAMLLQLIFHILLFFGYRRDIDERAKAILQQLLVAGVGDRPIVWVAHSAGGKYSMTM